MVNIMPVLPSGRRVEFSLDRFHALLDQIGDQRAKEIAATLHNPDDLLFVLDAVHFSLADGTPYFADYVAADWATYAADWSSADRRALQTWLASDTARASRAEAIGYIKGLLLDRKDSLLAYPYVVPHNYPHLVVHEGSMLRQ